MNRLTQFVGKAFIWSVGITKPRPGQERRALIYITSVLLLCIAMALAVFLAVITHHG